MTDIFYNKVGEHPLIGKRIKLIHTNDKYTDLRKGDLGTVIDITESDYGNERFTQIGVNWDNGSRLMLTQDKDTFEIVD